MTVLTRFEPYREFATLQDRLNRLFQNSFGESQDSLTTSSFSPAVDVYEDEHAVNLKIEVPGIDEEDLDIRVENNILTIRGERKFEKKVDEKNYLRVERSYGSFARSFSLANTVNSEAIKADYKDGVLTLTIPKREEAKPKQIKVSVGAQATAAVAR